MAAFPDVHTLVPQRGPSSLLDTVLSAGPERTECRATIAPDHVYMTSSGVHPLLAMELFAQAAAVHRALTLGPTAAADQAGHLAAADVRMQAARLDAPATLLVRITPGPGFGGLLRFAGELFLEGEQRVLVAEGEVTVAPSRGPGAKSPEDGA